VRREDVPFRGMPRTADSLFNVVLDLSRVSRRQRGSAESPPRWPPLRGPSLGGRSWPEALEQLLAVRSEGKVSKMPLGEKLWEEKSKAVGRRFLDVAEKAVHEEVSFVGEIKGFGKLKGVEGRVSGTDDYWEKLTGDVIHGTACGVMRLREDIIPFKAVGIGKMVRQSPLAIEKLLSLIYFVDPPPDFSWMRTTLVLWEAVTDPKSQTITATAYEWT